jgi:membrane carboxypeptidase/penicillin-binding protein
MKTGLTSEEVGNLNTAWDTPYPPELVVRLWIGKDNPFLIPRFAKAASTPQQSAQALRALNANEIGIIEPPETSSIEIEDVDFYDGDTLV